MPLSKHVAILPSLLHPPTLAVPPRVGTCRNVNKQRKIRHGFSHRYATVEFLHHQRHLAPVLEKWLRWLCGYFYASAGILLDECLSQRHATWGLCWAHRFLLLWGIRWHPPPLSPPIFVLSWEVEECGADIFIAQNSYKKGSHVWVPLPASSATHPLSRGWEWLPVGYKHPPPSCQCTYVNERASDRVFIVTKNFVVAVFFQFLSAIHFIRRVLKLCRWDFHFSCGYFFVWVGKNRKRDFSGWWLTLQLMSVIG